MIKQPSLLMLVLITPGEAVALHDSQPHLHSWRPRAQRQVQKADSRALKAVLTSPHLGQRSAGNPATSTTSSPFLQAAAECNSHQTHEPTRWSACLPATSGYPTNPQFTVAIPPSLPLLRTEHPHSRPLALQLRLTSQRTTQRPRDRGSDITRIAAQPADSLTKC